MQKYDDFGRPIYETAEEYNRAHGTGGSARRYDNLEADVYKKGTMRHSTRNQTAAQRYANREGSKKAKPLVVGMVAFFFAMIFVITITIFNMAGGIYEEAYSEPDYAYEDEVHDYEDEYLGDTDTPLPEGYESFTYNGLWVTLPTTCKEIAELGYELEAYNLTDMIPSDFWECISLLDEDGYTVAMISVSNETGYDIPLEECTVEYFYISNPNAYDEAEELPDFVFGDGLTLESSYEEVEAYFGVPYYHYEDYSDESYLYDSYQWEYYGEGERHFVMINFVNGEMLDISIEKDVYEE